ncbi:MAG: hypothetical protein ACREF3_07190, partial [Acetobacteraceae bacterium]
MRGSIYGYVVRGDSGMPVAGAKVTILKRAGPTAEMLGSTAVALSTSGSGWFTFDKIPEGTWLVYAVGPRGGRGNVEVPVFQNAVSEATVALNGLQRWLADTLASVDQSADAASADKGCDVGKRSGADWSSDLAVSTGWKESAMTGSVRGRVVRADTGLPVESATIGILSGAGPAPDIAPLSDADGRFVMDGLPPGEWAIGAIDADGRRGSVEFRIRKSAVTDV